MNEFRSALQNLLDAYKTWIGSSRADAPKASLALRIEADMAQALLARPEPEPRITRAAALKFLSRYAGEVLLALEGIHSPKDVEAAAEACILLMTGESGK